MAEPADEARSPAGNEARISAIVAGGRATRRRPARGAWIAAAIVGTICAIGFVLLLVRGDQPAADGPAAGSAAGSATGSAVGSAAGAGAEPRVAPRRGAGGAGCAGGLGLGLAIGLAIGFALGRRQAGARDHSSRSSP